MILGGQLPGKVGSRWGKKIHRTEMYGVFFYPNIEIICRKLRRHPTSECEVAMWVVRWHLRQNCRRSEPPLRGEADAQQLTAGSRTTLFRSYNLYGVFFCPNIEIICRIRTTFQLLRNPFCPSGSAIWPFGIFFLTSSYGFPSHKSKIISFVEIAPYLWYNLKKQIYPQGAYKCKIYLLNQY